MIDSYKFRDNAQPRPPIHWPELCAEVLSHVWEPTFCCGKCGNVFMEQPDEVDGKDVFCTGDGWPVLMAKEGA